MDDEAVETLVEKVIKGYGWSIISPRAIAKGGAPMIETPSGNDIRVPDTKANKDGLEVWVETKAKSTATWHRKTQTQNQGIDTVSWEDYLKVPRVTGDRVYLFFYEVDKGLLYRRCTDCLHVHHSHPSGGGDGEAMTYFDKEQLDRVPIRETMVKSVNNVQPQINLYKSPSEIDFKLFPHEMDSASGKSATLDDF